MAKFNTTVKRRSTKTENLAGGQAYQESPKLEFVSNLLTSFVQDQFYRTSNEGTKRVKELIDLISKTDPIFPAKAAVFARNEFGMRSVSHVVAGEVAKRVKGEEWTKRFYDKVVHRVDDITEILSYYTTQYGKPIPNSLKKGLGLAFGKFNEYQLAKYRGEGKGISLVDAVNLVHPTPTAKNKEALRKLVKDELKSTETWEVKLTQAGQNAESEEDKVVLKNAAWSDLIQNRKLGYFALLRNLRNILEQAPDLINDVCAQLVDGEAIKKSLVLPFRFITAYKELASYSSTKNGRQILKAINDAVEISLSNVPKFDGETLVVLDTSGSMEGRVSNIAGLFAATLLKTNLADFITFDTYARYVNYDPNTSLIQLAKKISFSGGGTNFQDIFLKANKKYDRVFILSDMQGWIGHYTPTKEFSHYCKQYNANPFVYSFDLQGYGTLQFPEKNVFCLAGFSDKVFDIVALLETDKNALIEKIEKITI